MAELRDKIAGTLKVWHAMNAVVCEHTQIISYGEATDAIMAEVNPVLGGWQRRALNAEAAIDRFRQRHTPHDCEQHVLARTPTPCVNNGLCRCGSTLPCPELAAFNGVSESETNDQTAPEPLIDPDCRDGKCGSCVGGPCECPHHSNEAVATDA